MAHLYTTPKCIALVFDPQGDPAKPWIVKGDHKFIGNGGSFSVVIDDGFRTDLASIPYRRLWIGAWFIGWLVSLLFGPWASLAVGLPLALSVAWVVNPYGAEQIAAVVHDQGYQQGKGSRFWNDALFRELMGRYLVHWVRALVLYLGVRAGGWLAWNAHRRAETKGTRR